MFEACARIGSPIICSFENSASNTLNDYAWFYLGGGPLGGGPLAGRPWGDPGAWGPVGGGPLFARNFHGGMRCRAGS